MKRVGIFGGTFDPVHLGHVELARAATKQFAFDELVIVPCALPPHRSSAQATSQQRLDMLSLVFSQFENTRISEYELTKTSLSYTVETLEFFAADQPGTQWVFCLGGDSLASLTQWHRWSDILGIANLVVMPRAGSSGGVAVECLDNELSRRVLNMGTPFTEKSGQIGLLDLKEVPVSATEIRKILAEYRNRNSSIEGSNNDELIERLGDYLDKRVLSYILKNMVYR